MESPALKNEVMPRGMAGGPRRWFQEHADIFAVGQPDRDGAGGGRGGCGCGLGHQIRSTIMAVDWPAAAFWPELSAHFPKAKIILTTRDPEAWYQSISRTIFPTLLNEPGSEEEENPTHRRMTYSLIIERVFKQKVNDRDFVLDVYQRNSLAVIRDIEPARLLQYQPGDGWKPLCDFLGVAVPEEPYPHVNNTAEFRKWVGLD